MAGLIYLLVMVGIMCIFGAVTKSINQNRGREGGFWWGFFLGVIGILIVALRPNE